MTAMDGVSRRLSDVHAHCSIIRSQRLGKAEGARLRVAQGRVGVGAISATSGPLGDGQSDDIRSIVPVVPAHGTMPLDFILAPGWNLLEHTLG